VSSGFFLSDEFRGRGYFAYRFYEVAFDRRPLYAEFVPDMAQVGGAQSPQSELLSKAAYTDAFAQRFEFLIRYSGTSNTAYVEALEQNAEITVTNKADLIAALTSGQKTRGQVLREIVESKAVEDKFFIRAFVAMQYFGYLRRDPDTIGYNNWVTTLTNDPSNFRHMILASSSPTNTAADLDRKEHYTKGAKEQRHINLFPIFVPFVLLRLLCTIASRWQLPTIPLPVSEARPKRLQHEIDNSLYLAGPWAGCGFGA